MLVEAVLQPQPEPGDLILQLPDGLAGVGGRDGNEERIIPLYDEEARPREIIQFA